MQPPCKDCITLSICRAEVQAGDLFNIMGLANKCIHMKYFIFPDKKPLVTSSQKVTDANKHLDACISILKEDLLKDIRFNDQFNFEAEPSYEGYRSI